MVSFGCGLVTVEGGETTEMESICVAFSAKYIESMREVGYIYLFTRLNFLMSKEFWFSYFKKSQCTSCEVFASKTERSDHEWCRC
jgi:hypothetical protein